MEKVNALLGWLEPRSQGSLLALLVMPLVPVSLGAVYVMARRRDIHPPVHFKESAQFPDTYHATLTRDEFHLLARYRRSRHNHPTSTNRTPDPEASSTPSQDPGE